MLLFQLMRFPSRLIVPPIVVPAQFVVMVRLPLKEPVADWPISFCKLRFP